jgi:hypothetical protein
MVGSLSDAPDFDFVGVFLGLSEVVSRLEAKPGLGAPAKCFIEPDRHFRRDRRFAINQII